ncbi:MAG: hypothetical protein CO189_03180 [candidate division Zixibacteria bacterium CG_4_9_14_3_um_filter_46_8]|nr:MAG: hypothetical protein CO189_03180 [candidate division Zixibacteria bacterium CG_4_9_14_3_um_filter_46_8]
MTLPDISSLPSLSEKMLLFKGYTITYKLFFGAFLISFLITLISGRAILRKLLLVIKIVITIAILVMVLFGLGDFFVNGDFHSYFANIF